MGCPEQGGHESQAEAALGRQSGQQEDNLGTAAHSFQVRAHGERNIGLACWDELEETEGGGHLYSTKRRKFLLFNLT